MKATEFDRKFDAGEDVSGHVDWSKGKRPNEQIKRYCQVNRFEDLLSALNTP